MSVERPCPECKKLCSITKENKFRPFCSERCRLIDLGEWASGGYSVPAQPAHTDFDAEKEISQSENPDEGSEDSRH